MNHTLCTLDPPRHEKLIEPTPVPLSGGERIIALLSAEGERNTRLPTNLWSPGPPAPPQT